MAGLFRLDQLIAALARERLWLTDAYFVGLTPYVQALCAAARDGVDVRLLVPGASDIPVVSPLSRAGYRPLLESGVRVFEWNGSMLHAKSAVADARWARVGSTNLNVASFWANYELDVAVEDERVPGEVAEMYEQDLEHATEIVLARRNRVRRSTHGQRRRRQPGARVRAALAAPPPVPSAWAARWVPPSRITGCWGRPRRACWALPPSCCWRWRRSVSSGPGCWRCRRAC